MNQAYMSGFGNEFATEAITGALPQGRNSPQRPAFGLYLSKSRGALLRRLGIGTCEAGCIAYCPRCVMVLINPGSIHPI
jgi:hypothetical protein